MSIIFLIKEPDPNSRPLKFGSLEAVVLASRELFQVRVSDCEQLFT